MKRVRDSVVIASDGDESSESEKDEVQAPKSKIQSSSSAPSASAESSRRLRKIIRIDDDDPIPLRSSNVEYSINPRLDNVEGSHELPQIANVIVNPQPIPLAADTDDESESDESDSDESYDPNAEEEEEEEEEEPEEVAEAEVEPIVIDDSDDEEEKDNAYHDSEDDPKPENYRHFNVDMGFVTLWRGNIQMLDVCGISATERPIRGNKGAAGAAIILFEVFVQNRVSLCKKIRDVFESHFDMASGKSWFMRNDDMGNREGQMIDIVKANTHTRKLYHSDEFTRWLGTYKRWKKRRDAWLLERAAQLIHNAH